MTRQQRIHLAQRARSMAYDAWWQAVCEQVEFSLYDARKAPKIIPCKVLTGQPNSVQFTPEQQKGLP